MDRDTIPMNPAPGLEAFSRSFDTPRGDRLFCFDSAAGSPGAGTTVAEASTSGGGAIPTGLPLVLVHGLGDEADSFRLVFPALAATRRVLAPDLPGFGRSVAGGRVTIRACVEAVLALVEAELPGGAVFAGSSLGAVIAELAALARPDLAKGLVLIDGGLPTAPGPGGLDLASLLPGFGEKGYRAFRGHPEAAYESLRPYYASLDALPEAERAFLKKRVVERVESEGQLKAYFSLMRSLVAEAALRSGHHARRLSSSGLPLLVLWGGRDALLPPAGAKLLAGIAPQATVRIIAEAGHLPQQEAPGEVVAAIGDFLAGLEEGKDSGRVFR